MEENRKISARQQNPDNIVPNSNQQEKYLRLVDIYKKSGEYDKLKSQILQEFMDGEAKQQVSVAVRNIVQQELDKNPEMLNSNSQANTASLLQGAIEKKSSIKSVKHEQQVYHVIREFLDERLNSEDLKKSVESSIKRIEIEKGE